MPCHGLGAESTMDTFLATAVQASEIGHVPYTPSLGGVLDMVTNAGPMVKFILAGLICLSIGCWGIIALKFSLIVCTRKHSVEFIALFRKRKDFALLYKDSEPLHKGHLVEIFRTGHEELNRMVKTVAAQNGKESVMDSRTLLENVERAMQGAMAKEKQRLERFLPFLATTGSTAPFIGLFGTVWGIMTSFQEIGTKGAANLAVVAPGISEALIATAMGLAAAIPAVIAFNHFSNRIGNIEGEMNRFSTDYLNILKRDLIRQAKQQESLRRNQNLASPDDIVSTPINN